MSWKKMLAGFRVAVVVGFYTTFVIQNLWNWFAVPALHVPEISYWTMYGLLLGARLVFEKDETFEKAEVFGRVGMMIEACVPEEKQADLNAQLLAEDEKMGTKILSMVAGQAVGNTITLGIAFAIHIFAG